MKKARLLILGASGHGKVAGDCARAAGLWSELVFFDDRWPDLNTCGPWPVCGTGEALFAQIRPEDQAFVAIGHAETRIKLLHRMASAGLDIGTVIHPSAAVSAGAIVEAGCLVAAGAVVNIGARVGLGCIVNTGATVDHDCILAEGVHVCPGAHLAGDVRIGRGTWVGIGSVVCQGIRIGQGALIGAGSAVVDPVADWQTVAGVPARPLGTKNP
ncbi:MAG: acetyltransferase [Syntrophaceae bacterium]|nr:acetyltransferase [Syntrophaceae bacterium]